MRMMKPACVIVAFSVAVACAVSAVAAQPKQQKGGHAHAHPTEGPHRGSLIELGKEDFHAEMVHDHAANAVTIYILDGAAHDAVPIDAKQVTLNLLVTGKPQQFQLAARPQPTDPEGKSSAFGCTSEQMCRVLDAKGTTGRLNVEIAGKMFVGKLGGHTHAH